MHFACGCGLVVFWWHFGTLSSSGWHYIFIPWRLESRWPESIITLCLAEVCEVMVPVGCQTVYGWVYQTVAPWAKFGIFYWLVDAVFRQLMQTVQNGVVLPRPTDVACHDDIYAVIKSCSDVEPDKRPTPQIIVRNIRSLLTKGLATDSTSYNLVSCPSENGPCFCAVLFLEPVDIVPFSVAPSMVIFVNDWQAVLKIDTTV